MCNGYSIQRRRFNIAWITNFVSPVLQKIHIVSSQILNDSTKDASPHSLHLPQSPSLHAKIPKLLIYLYIGPTYPPSRPACPSNPPTTQRQSTTAVSASLASTQCRATLQGTWVLLNMITTGPRMRGGAPRERGGGGPGEMWRCGTEGEGGGIEIEIEMVERVRGPRVRGATSAVVSNFFSLLVYVIVQRRELLVGRLRTIVAIFLSFPKTWFQAVSMF
jgi:hypothetical protein